MLWGGVLLCFVSLAACIGLVVLDFMGEKSRKGGEDFTVDENIELSAIFRFPFSLYLVMVICVMFYVTIFSFITISSAEFEIIFGYPEIVANIVTAIPYILAAIVCPIGGFLVDKLGRHAIWVLGSTFAISYAHASLIVAPGGAFAAPIIAMIVIGLAYTVCAASLWPSVALLAKEKELGTAYGTMTSVQNTGLAIAPIIVGAITNDPNHPDYRYAELFFALCGFTAFLLTALLIFLDRRGAKKLTVSPEDLRQRLEEEKLTINGDAWDSKALIQ